MVATAGGGGPDIDALAGLVNWYRGDLLTGSDGDRKQTFPDTSGASNDATHGSGTSTNWPTLKTGVLNGKNVLQWSVATNQVIATPNSVGSLGEGAIFVVARTTGGTSARVIGSPATTPNWLVGWWSGARAQCYANTTVKLDSTPAAGTGWWTYAARLKTVLVTTTVDFYENDTNIASASGAMNLSGTLSMGGSAGEDSDCQIAEIVRTNVAPSDADMANALAALRSRWNHF